MTAFAALPSPTQIACALAACGVVLAGVWGGHMRDSRTADKGGAMVLAPMIGVIEPCILALADSNAPSLNAMTTACTAPQGSAAALVESTLKGLENGQTTRYPLGYTLPVPLLQLFRQDASGNWVIDDTTVGRLARTVRDSPRPVVVYLFSTHFASGAPLEQVLAQDPANLMHTRDGPMPEGVYGGAPIHHWTLARTDTTLTQRRMQAAQALMDALSSPKLASFSRTQRGISAPHMSEKRISCV